MKTLIFIGLIILAIWLYYKHIRKKLKNMVGTWNCYVGSNGCGKSALSVDDSIRDYNRQVAKYKRIKFLNEKLKIPYKKRDYKEYKNHEPLLLSSIPICINKRKKLYSHELTKEHLLLQEKIPFRSTIYIDEVGEWASQFRFKDENIINVFDEFARFVRHYTDSHVFCNDQTSDFIEEHIRKRINLIKVLSNFKVYLGFICIYFERQIIVGEDKNFTIDTKQDENETDTQDNRNIRVRLNFHLKSYDTRCYRERYDSVPYKSTNLKRYCKLTKNDLLQCPTPKEHMYQAKTNRKMKGETNS